jgi:hypothetical protein
MSSWHPRQRPIPLLRYPLLGGAAATVAMAVIGTQAAFAQSQRMPRRRARSSQLSPISRWQ